MSDILSTIFTDAPSVERACTTACKKNDVSCPNKECRYWIDYEDDLNCSFISIDKNESGLTLREVGERLRISFVRVCQIEKAAVQKLRKKIQKPVSGK